MLCDKADEQEELRIMPKKAKERTQEETTLWIYDLIQANDLHAFYISTAWLRLRAEVLREQHHECQICKAKGRYAQADTVHHIKTVRKYPWLALVKGNLIAVCDTCHYEIHHGGERKWGDERW